MAESAEKTDCNGSNDQADCQDTDDDAEDSTKIECAVCLQFCVHPVQLPCGHIFCFLCVKGVANQSKRCAMCRKELPVDYLERPNLVGGTVLDGPSSAFDDGNQWFYEGHNGWWQYDERTSAELETAFKSGEGTCELLIAGFLYVIDFQAMVQSRRNDPSRRRHIKRDLVSILKKGIAGLRVTPSQGEIQDGRVDVAYAGETGGNAMVASITTAQALSELVLPSTRARNAPTSTRPKSPSPVPVAPNNTPQTPHTPSQDSGTSSPTTPCEPILHHIIQDMENILQLDSADDSDDYDLSGPHHPTFPDDLSH